MIKLFCRDETGWVEIIPKPSDSLPLSDGETSAGTSNNFARADHVHPDDYKEADSNLENKIYQDSVSTGKEGQECVVRYDNITNTNRIGTREPIQFLNMVTTEQELADAKLLPVATSQIFTDWYRFSHYFDGQNLANGVNTTFTAGNVGNYHYDTRIGWSYDASSNKILSNRNSPIYSGFINPNPLSTWYLKIRLEGADNDNDIVGIVCAFYRDSNGVEHTISLLRSQGLLESSNGTGNIIYMETFPCPYKWALVYDFRCPGNREKVLASGEAYIPEYYRFEGGHTGWLGTFCDIDVFRTKTKLTCRTSLVGSDQLLDDQSKIVYTLPTSKPADWSDEMWDAMNHMLGKRSQLGFSCYSENGHFSILDQKYIFDDSDIYDVMNDEILTYNENSKTWVHKGTVSDVILESSTIYNKNTSKLLYYVRGNALCLANQEISDNSDILNILDNLNIPIPSNSTPFDLGIANSGNSTQYARSDHVHNLPNIPNPSNELPNANGIANAGSSFSYSRADHVHPKQEIPSIPSASSTTPKANGTANVGSETSFARGDHVHPLQVNISGNAATSEDSTKWGGATKIVSTSTPSGGVNGDIWFQII